MSKNHKKIISPKTKNKRRGISKKNIIFSFFFLSFFLIVILNVRLHNQTNLKAYIDSNTQKGNHFEKKNDINVFHVASTVPTLHPKKTYFTPSFMAHPNATIFIKPIFGQHRPNRDAVFAFAEQYPVEVYVQFLTSLRNSGYQGDVVLSVSTVDKMKRNVEKYLKQQSSAKVVQESDIALIVYAVDWTCYHKDGTPIDHVKSGFSDCQANLYGME